MTLNKTIIRLASLMLVTSLLWGGIACTRKKNIQGDDYIDRDELVQVIMDMHLMDGITNDMKYYRKYNPDDSIDIYSPIFEKYDVTREMYDRTIEAYSEYPKLLDEVYDEVLMQLQLLQDRIESEEESNIQVFEGK